jgi:hypothetical protein
MASDGSFVTTTTDFPGDHIRQLIFTYAVI